MVAAAVAVVAVAAVVVAAVVVAAASAGFSQNPEPSFRK